MSTETVHRDAGDGCCDGCAVWNDDPSVRNWEASLWPCDAQRLEEALNKVMTQTGRQLIEVDAENARLKADLVRSLEFYHAVLGQLEVSGNTRTALEAENARLREALEWYSKKSNFPGDRGARARRALGPAPAQAQQP